MSEQSAQPIPVTVDTFVRAETDMTLHRYAAQGGFGKLLHVRQPVPLDRQDVIRMNRDTLYSIGIFDLTHPLTIVKPESDGRFQSLLLISQDHSMQPVEHGAGEFVVTQDLIGTRYVTVVFRTFVDANDPQDIATANALQDRIETRQEDVGAFEVPVWEEESLTKLRHAINVLASTKKDARGLFGDKAKLNPINHLLGTAFGWGGNPEEAAIYFNVVPEHNDGETPYVLTVGEVPVEGFWSITVYNADGFMEPNQYNANSLNNVTAQTEADGSVVVHFGGDPSASNFLPITPGWNYVARMYQPRKVLMDGEWSFPAPVPVG